MIAQTKVRDELCHKIQLLEDRLLAKLELVTCALAGATPLASPHVQAVDEKLIELDTKVEIILSKVVDYDHVHSRIDRLEALLIASPKMGPSVDEVLNRMLPTSKAANKGLDLPFVSEFPHYAKGNTSKESSNVAVQDNMFVEQVMVEPARAGFEAGACWSEPRKTFKFDIFDSSEDAEVQTNVALVSRSSQTCAMPKLRKSRCHGRASQTDTSIAGVSELGVTDSQEVSSVSTAGCRGMFTGPWLQLPHDDWQSIHTKFPKKCSRFGFSVGELVGWVTSDSDVPLGSRGKVIGFSEDAVEVEIAAGEYCFPPGVLYRVGENVQGVRGVKLGDLVEWTTRDSYVSCVSQGQAGVVTGSQLQKIVIDFGKGQHLSLEPADVQVLT